MKKTITAVAIRQEREKTTPERLEEILSAGREAAYEMRGTKDGGTCNLDTAVLRLPRVHADTVAEAAKRAAVDVEEAHWLGRCFFVYVGHGQGACRTAMVEAACRAMEEKIEEVGRPGWSAEVFYQMD